MSRKRLILITGIVLLGGLGLIEASRGGPTLEPANIISVQQVIPDAGPDQWRVTFELSDRNEYTADPVSTRPQFGAGDPVCVRAYKRSWARNKYQITNETSCWSGAVTPLRAPD